MTWIGLLLADPSPSLRLLVMRNLLRRQSDDGEVQELEPLRLTDPLVSDLLRSQETDGSWKGDASGGSGDEAKIRATSFALGRLGYLGLGREQDAVRSGAGYLFSQQQADGSWPLPKRRREDEESGGYSMIPLQTAFPLHGLAACGYATDPRAEKAYDWLLAQRLPEGAWPTGIAAGDYGYVAGYRRIAHSRWGCRSNTTGVLRCLALHPQRRSGPPARKALDLLLGRETREAYALGFEVTRLMGFEPARGFVSYYARFDLALLLDLCCKVGASLEDERIVELTEFVRGLQGPYGLWEYAPRPQASRWVTYDILSSLSGLAQSDTPEWISMEPRTPFQPYTRKERRF